MEAIQETIKEKLIKKESVKTDTTVQTMLCEQVSEEAQVILHCTLSAAIGSRIRIWKTTYLYDTGSSHTSQLLHAQGINIYPSDWIRLPANCSQAYFTLIFNGLPKDCRVFNMLEIGQDPANFSVNGIERNRSDVYNVTIFSENLRRLGR